MCRRLLGAIRLRATSTCSVVARRSLKVLWHDGIGLSLYAKRLDRGRFVWPSTVDGVVAISPAQLGYLLEGSTGASATHLAAAERRVHACGKIDLSGRRKSTANR